MARGLGALLAVALAFAAGTGASAQHVLEDAGTPELTDAERTEDALVAAMAAPWIGDLDGMVARGFVRMGVPHEPVTFVYDGPEQRGIAVEFGREFEAHLRATLGAGAETLTVAFLPLTRDTMLDALVSGRVDVLAANLTVTPGRAERVDFADPMIRGIRELVVTGPAAPPVTSLDDLAAVPVHVRPSSSYHEHLAALNAARAGAGAPPIPIIAAEEALEDYDLVELVDVGVIPAVILDSHKAELYAQIFEHLTVHDDLAVNEGGEIAWAIRKGSPQLMDATNAFVAKARKGTELGNILYRRWIADPTRVMNAIAPGEDAKFVETIGFIRRHATAYDFDPVLIAAQGYQESRLDQSERSAAGAIGIMQLMPATARDPQVGIPDIEDGRAQRRGRGQVSPAPARRVFQRSRHHALRPGLLRLRRLQRRPGKHPEGARPSREHGPRPERLVRQRRGGGRPHDQPGAGGLRAQHPEVLHELPDLPGRGGDRRGFRPWLTVAMLPLSAAFARGAEGAAASRALTFPARGTSGACCMGCA